MIKERKNTKIEQRKKFEKKGKREEKEKKIRRK